MADTNLSPQPPTGLSLDTIGFLKAVAANMTKAHDYAYPGGYLDKDRVHGALCKIQGQVGILQVFLDNLEEK
jgi:hypothetical protein